MVRWQFEYRSSPLAAVRSDPYYASVSHYAFQLAPYIGSDLVRRQCSLWTYERLIAEPVRQIQALYAWLGVDATFVPPDITEPVNVTPEVIEQARMFGLLKRFSQSTAWSVAAPYVSKKFRTRMATAAVRRVRPAQTSTDALVEYLRPLQRAQTRELSRLLGRTFPEWENARRLNAIPLVGSLRLGAVAELDACGRLARYAIPADPRQRGASQHHRLAGDFPRS